MEHRRVGRDLFIRLDKGEELHDSIRSLSKHGITAAALTSGIGRIRNTSIGYLDAEGVYRKVIVKEPMELLSMQGNLAPGPEGPFSHIHIVASDDDYVVRGGHLFEATVEVTAEIHMRVLGDESAPMEREETESEFLRISFCNLGE
ncbi:MAG TPA: DUF296 domain-containing protein [Candidatus Thalassarchaeaceae archaeon]|jgi:hypothetical protein|nr:DUF296 domain-containing protein [Candidatus Thalassarchaeaceae archaeon]